MRLPQLTGTLMFALAGGTLVLVGAIFLLTLAISNGWVTPPIQVCLAWIGGAALIVVGVRLHRRREVLGVGIAPLVNTVVGVGGGIMILGNVAAARLYDYAVFGISAGVGMVLTGVVGALLVAASLRLRSQLVAVFGVGSALLSPLLLGVDPGWGAVGFVAVALAVAAALAVWSRWSWLPQVALWCTVPQLALFVHDTLDAPGDATAVGLVTIAWWALVSVGAAGILLAPRRAPTLPAPAEDGDDLGFDEPRADAGTAPFLLARFAVLLAPPLAAAIGGLALHHISPGTLGDYLAGFSALLFAIVVGLGGREGGRRDVTSALLPAAALVAAPLAVAPADFGSLCLTAVLLVVMGVAQLTVRRPRAGGSLATAIQQRLDRRWVGVVAVVVTAPHVWRLLDDRVTEGAGWTLAACAIAAAWWLLATAPVLTIEVLHPSSKRTAAWPSWLHDFAALRPWTAASVGLATLTLPFLLATSRQATPQAAAAVMAGGGVAVLLLAEVLRRLRPSGTAFVRWLALLGGLLLAAPVFVAGGAPIATLLVVIAGLLLLAVLAGATPAPWLSQVGVWGTAPLVAAAVETLTAGHTGTAPILLVVAVALVWWVLVLAGAVVADLTGRPAGLRLSTLTGRDSFVPMMPLADLRLWSALAVVLGSGRGAWMMAQGLDEIAPRAVLPVIAFFAALHLGATLGLRHLRPQERAAAAWLSLVGLALGATTALVVFRDLDVTASIQTSWWGVAGLTLMLTLAAMITAREDWPWTVLAGAAVAMPFVLSTTADKAAVAESAGAAFLATLIALALWWLPTVAGLVAREIRRTGQKADDWTAIGVFGALLVSSVAGWSILRHHTVGDWPGWWLLLVAGANLAAAIAVRLWTRVSGLPSWLAVAAAAAAAWSAEELLDGAWLVFAWAALGLLLVELYRRDERTVTGVAATILGVATIGRTLFADLAPPTALVWGAPHGWQAVLALAIVTAALATAAVRLAIVDGGHSGARPLAWTAAIAFVYLASVAAVSALSPAPAESAMWTGDGLEYTQSGQLGLSMVWIVLGLAALTLGLVRRDRRLRLFGIVLSALAAAKVLLIDTAALERGYRVLAFIVVGIVLLVGAYLLNRLDKALGGDSDERGDTDDEATDPTLSPT